MPIIFPDQLDLPIAADHDKSPIRKQEWDNHANAELHIQNDGLPDQMLVMTATGPRMMTPKLTCACGGGHYGCECRVVFDDLPPKPLNIICSKTWRGVTQVVENEGTSANPAWTLDYEDVSTYFEFDPVSVYECNPVNVRWTLTNTPANNMRMVEYPYAGVNGRNYMRLWYDMLGTPPFDVDVKVGISPISSPNMRLRIRRIN
jgi:hypothetical protein